MCGGKGWRHLFFLPFLLHTVDTQAGGSTVEEGGREEKRRGEERRGEERRGEEKDEKSLSHALKGIKRRWRR